MLWSLTVSTASGKFFFSNLYPNLFFIMRTLFFIAVFSFLPYVSFASMLLHVTVTDSGTELVELRRYSSVTPSGGKKRTAVNNESFRESWFCDDVYIVPCDDGMVVHVEIRDSDDDAVVFSSFDVSDDNMTFFHVGVLPHGEYVINVTIGDQRYYASLSVQ